MSGTEHCWRRFVYHPLGPRHPSVTESVVLPPDRKERAMCEKCFILQKKITHYREFLKQRFDPQTEERIAETIKELEQQKAALH
jgi:hypothetical protein